MQNQSSGPFQLSRVLAEELEAIKGPICLDADTYGTADLQQAVTTAGASQAGDEPAAETKRRQFYYYLAHQFDLSALCLSGGGIRSASFSLGVIQGLAESGLLKKIDYFSTVSGGGYIGSWLSAWLHWNGKRGRNADDVLRDLMPRRQAADQEPPPIRHLREYSSYLTPKTGLLSGDFWAAVAIIFRNLLLNWFILIPLIALPVVAVKLIAALLQTAQFGDPWFAERVLLFCLVLAGLGLKFKIERLYSVRPPFAKAQEEPAFLLWSLLPAMVAGFCFCWAVNWLSGLPTPSLTWADWADGGGWRGWVTVAGAAFGVYIVASLVAYPWIGTRKTTESPPDYKDWAAWAAGAIGWGTLIWLGVYLYAKLDFSFETLPIDTACIKDASVCIRHQAPLIYRHQVLAIFGMPWFLSSIMLTQTIYILIRSYSSAGDFERESLGRAGGWYMVAGLGWIVLSTVVLLGPPMWHQLVGASYKWLTAIGGVSGALTAFLGRSSLTSAEGANTGWRSLTSNILLAVAGPVFALILLILLSMTFDAIAFGKDYAFYKPALVNGNNLDANYWTAIVSIAGSLLIVVPLLSIPMNINRFSLHAVYRNRLIRAYLGGPRTYPDGPRRYPDAPSEDRRKPDGFTGFDQNDNFRLSMLWPRTRSQRGSWRPFHVINMTLNLPATKRLAWQQRKAISFAATPLFCGAADPELGYRRTEEYGDPGGGMSLGTAMAISGAAASSNMGYHSSPTAAFLLTVFNVRLGWWLGNPGRRGSREPRSQKALKYLVHCVAPAGGATRPAEPGRFRRWVDRPRMPYVLDAPLVALRPLLSELFGLMDEESPYVYLSDGGHFEDLGIYEMVRRRCKWIVAIDGDADPERGFIDLGDAVRKVWIDLGVRISFENADLLQATRETKPENVPYFALGTIEYVSDEPVGGKTPTGQILYIKPTVRGDEWAADIIAYKRANPDFPHQSTGDQWFDEPQLEAYRALGYLTFKRIVDAVRELPPKGQPADLADLFSRLKHLNPKTFGQRFPLYDEA